MQPIAFGMRTNGRIRTGRNTDPRGNLWEPAGVARWKVRRYAVSLLDGFRSKLCATLTAAGVRTTAIIIPDRLYVIPPKHGGALVLADT